MRWRNVNLNIELQFSIDFDYIKISLADRQISMLDCLELESTHSNMQFDDFPFMWKPAA